MAAPIAFATAKSSGLTTVSKPGMSSVIEVDLGDQTYALLAFLDGAVLVLVFADGTTGRESYAPGRFLRLPPPDADGQVAVDFNRAIIPPCGFSHSYSCPLPPAQNRIAAPVRAGERRVQWRQEAPMA